MFDEKYGMSVHPVEYPHLSKRSITTGEVTAGGNGSSDGARYKVIEHEASGLTTYITVSSHYHILIVRNLHNRLIITLPEDVHDLRSTRFYMLLQGVGSQSDDLTFGSLFFRQDQPRIDLFVFFSVFFSCFFLFLAACVIVWKIKQSVEFRRAQQRHVVELLTMAKRPFASLTLIVEESEEYENNINSYPN